MKLIFTTPSRRCPYRHRNEQEVEILFQAGESPYVRRAKGRIAVFAVRAKQDHRERWWAYADELHVEPER